MDRETTRTARRMVSGGAAHPAPGVLYLARGGRCRVHPRSRASLAGGLASGIAGIALRDETLPGDRQGGEADASYPPARRCPSCPRWISFDGGLS